MCVQTSLVPLKGTGVSMVVVVESGLGVEYMVMICDFQAAGTRI
jgi:hypothetical protein